MTYDINRYEPGYGGRINSSGEVVNIADAISGGAITIAPISTTTHYVFDGAVGPTEVIFNLGADAKKIIYISNDGDSDLYFNFNSYNVSIPTINGTNDSIRLQPGETINDFDVKFYRIRMRRPAGSLAGVVRILAV
jgi:hypothetical protein